MNKKNYYENKCNSVQVLVKLAENAKKLVLYNRYKKKIYNQTLHDTKYSFYFLHLVIK